MQKKNEVTVAAPAKPKPVRAPVEELEPMDIEPDDASVPPAVKVPEPAASPPIKKKKKKASYKDMMAGITHSSNVRDLEKEKESLRKVTGGGAFSKIDKI
jgi:hypothetical protein